ncbi:MAG: hypothetical protein R3286_05300 [Gammaproteobacteria bacterium]|nr:hypothetical protein [Gammaproteobacteria bacterium]
MELELYWSITSALGVALLASLLFVAASNAWLSASGRLRRRNPFAEQIFYEPGHRVRQQLRALETRYFVYLASLLVFVLVVFAVWIVNERPPLLDLPSWAWLAVSVVLLIASLFLPFQIIKLKRARSRLAYLSAANMAVGHALQKIASRGNHVFHNVRCGSQTNDNVVVGPKGVFAVNVFVYDRPKGGKGKAGAKSGTIRFDNSSLVLGNSKTNQPVSVALKRVGELGRELSKVTGHPIKVRSVIAVPGWNVTSSSTDQHLLVNEKTVVMLTGWTDPNTYLMDEDVERITEYLTRRCANGKAAV